ncbi:MAG: hypothetical protein AAGA15_12240 [Pseudomonadota bacterium]
MKLNYDIDILPQAVDRTPVGQSKPARVHYAAFRDPETARAARDASPRTIAILSDAGISFDCYSSGMPEGHFPSKDQAQREYLLACLLEAITSENSEVEEGVDGSFDLSECLVALSSASPFGPVVPWSPPHTHMPRPTMAVYLAVSVLAVAGYMAGFAVMN